MIVNHFWGVAHVSRSVAGLCRARRACVAHVSRSVAGIALSVAGECLGAQICTCGHFYFLGAKNARNLVTAIIFRFSWEVGTPSAQKNAKTQENDLR